MRRKETEPLLKLNLLLPGAEFFLLVSYRINMNNVIYLIADTPMMVGGGGGGGGGVSKFTETARYDIPCRHS